MLCYLVFPSSHFTDWASSYHKLAQALHASTNDGADIHILPPTLVGILASLQLICSQKLQAKSSIDSSKLRSTDIFSIVYFLINTNHQHLLHIIFYFVEAKMYEKLLSMIKKIIMMVSVFSILNLLIALDSTQTILSCVCNLIPACNMKLSSLSSIPSTDTPSLLLSSPPKEVPCADALPLQQV